MFTRRHGVPRMRMSADCSWLSIVLLTLAMLLPSRSSSAEFDDDFNIPKGWRMQDRFHGFRYEAFVGEGCESYATAAQAAADELACFGWAQWTVKGTVVGEGRCSKATGGHMIERLREGPGDGCLVRRLQALDYADTKIKLHFSHFKILDETRRTCFRDPPHQCPEFASENSADRFEMCADEEDSVDILAPNVERAEA